VESNTATCIGRLWVSGIYPDVIDKVSTTTKWMTEEATGQWRASKMIGLNVYNSLSEKIGTIKGGKLEAVVVGARGFLGIGERDVAVPFSQIEWSYHPVASSGIGTPSTTTGAASTVSQKNLNAGAALS
jgi:hypothetical protein